MALVRRKNFEDLHDLQLSELRAEMAEEKDRRPPQRGPPPPRGVSQRGVPPTRGRREPYDGYQSAVSDLDSAPPAPPVRAVVRADRGVGIDVHETLKQEVFGVPQPGCDDHFEKNRPCPSGVYGVSDQYIVLDSFEKIWSSNVARGEFQWNFMVQGVTGDQVLGVRDKIDTVIEIQMASFMFPNLEEVPYVTAAAPPVPSGRDSLVLVKNNTNAAPPPVLAPSQYPPNGPYTTPPSTPWICNPYTQLPFGNRVTVQIKEAGLQSYSDRNGARHNFEFTVGSNANNGANPTILTAVPLGGSQWDTFTFTDPLKSVDGITLVFRGVDVPIAFLPDVFYDVTIAPDGAAAPGPFLRIEAPTVGLNAGDRIFILGYQSGNPTLDAYMNRPEGHVAAGDPSLAPLAPNIPLVTQSATSFYTDPAVSVFNYTTPIAPQRVNVYVAKRRLRIPIRLRRVVGRLTNYIAP
jgi:hypothetical protein